ncbi:MULTISPECIES: hypothetical protein [Rhodanobacter]|uniref:hypothetical protein n=1 Tax=Rhodanobacter TaxID=75309 RepID=UPI00040D7078|nr:MULTISPECIES: hypothetical protein [Rhodanobacter]TAN16669.1 MAG: hypothetical protein EPN35_09545 [Rhodanobacter sp.]UJJ55506.1 hypothetical protein LRK53_03660 [Rhodanobacter thiooxydans]
MRRLVASLPLALLLAACSPSPAPPPSDTAGPSAPANAALGSPEWYAWVDRSLQIADDGHGPSHGSDAWNRAVQAKLGQEAPQSQPGSPQWQQAVDALLRTRLRPSS